MLFTVVIPIFNSAEYILRTLESVQKASKESDYEIILIDDCSKDIDKLKETIAPFKQVKLIEKKAKTNAADSRNIGFLQSESRYVFFLDSDDSFIAGSIDKRIKSHEQSEAGIIFGNFITNYGITQRKSKLPNYNAEDMRNYILVKKGDFRSSVISIDKKHYNGTLFDGASQKHQDWIFAFTCWDNKERIIFDEQYSTIINIGRSTRMSSSLNVGASKYLCEKYLNDVEYINSFSKNNWNNMIFHKDREACDFFISMYKPQKKSEYLKYNIYKLMVKKSILPLSSGALAILKYQRAKLINRRVK